MHTISFAIQVEYIENIFEGKTNIPNWYHIVYTKVLIKRFYNNATMTNEWNT